jgi:hypothetical protein
MSDVRILDISGPVLDGTNYDILVAALGFESRAVAISLEVAASSKRRYAIGFDHNHTEAYAENYLTFERLGFEIRGDISSTGFPIIVDEILSGDPPEPLRIAVDISCFDRQRLAVIVDCLWAVAERRLLHVDFLYSIAAFRPPSRSLGRNEIAGPVHKSFAGRFTDPGRPLALLAGLGYEVGKVVGAAEYLQASRIIAFFPESPILEYAPEVANANELLLEDLPVNDIIKYPVADCKKTIAVLDSVINGLGDTYNIVMLPGGPKIFVLSCLIAQRIHRQTSVWRVSSGASISPRNVEASASTVSVSMSLGPISVPVA